MRDKEEKSCMKMKSHVYEPICYRSEDFYFRRLYLRIQDCFGRPIASAPDAWFDVVERYPNDNKRTMNLSPGTTTIHKELEKWVADFVGKPAALVFCMGYVTNSALLIEEEGLIISDSLNHKSIVNGARGSGATIIRHHIWRQCLREQIADGQPRTQRPWKKIIVVAYLYLDEAHSIGAVGKAGRGVCDLLGVDTADVVVMMGTFSKSSGSSGGYIAGSKVLVQYLKYTCPVHINLHGFEKLGFEVLGDQDSPVMPIMLYNPAKIPAFSRECLKHNVAVVTVGFPATSPLLSRARIRISASHTREDLLRALDVCIAV
ncbi:Aspartate 1-decarboxylase, pyridoxal-dependent [Parasponia andersonii]|uniref:Aspartate 1-decarboxylase, pyridoxal-dependent n=1 Tax=Parasponia andersonii TaxID=3476 RepID=A0A2P5DV78_PARAD|nr:Aspartate 1-decarboxylase, pyridoxal-dependent [Parasponia andersonii]